MNHTNGEKLKGNWVLILFPPYKAIFFVVVVFVSAVSKYIKVFNLTSKIQAKIIQLFKKEIIKLLNIVII